MPRERVVKAGWRQVAPPLEILDRRFLALEHGSNGGDPWWRLVIYDDTPNARALHTGLTIWEIEGHRLTESDAKKFFDRFAKLFRKISRQYRDLLGVATWEALHDVDRARANHGDMNIDLADQLELLEDLVTRADKKCIETVARMMHFTPEALGGNRLKKALEYATEIIRYTS